MTVERRRFVRKPIGGNAEITSVVGSTTEVPSGRATILNCSRGGALLRVPSPRRRMLKKLEPCLAARDSITCVIRVPPGYGDFEVFAEVVRVVKYEAHDFVDAAVRFFYDVQRKSHIDKAMRQLMRALGPEAWGESSHTNLVLTNYQPPQVEGASPGRGTSKRLKQVKESKRLKGEGGASKRLKRESRRLKKSDSKRLKSDSKRVKRDGASKRLEPSDTPSRRSGRVTIKHHSSAAQAPLEPKPRPKVSKPAVYFGLAGPESGLYLRGRAKLKGGQALIEFPGHFAGAIDPSTLTVHLTPTGECFGLFVAGRSEQGVVVRELGGGSGSAAFDYLLIGQRRGTA